MLLGAVVFAVAGVTGLILYADLDDVLFFMGVGGILTIAIGGIILAWD